MSSLILISSCVISKSLRDTLESRPVVKAIDTHFHTIQCSASRSPWHPRDWRHSENRDTHFFSGGITYLLSAATVLWLKRKVRIVLQQCVVCTFHNKSFTSMTWGSMSKGEAGGGVLFPTLPHSLCDGHLWDQHNVSSTDRPDHSRRKTLISSQILK